MNIRSKGIERQIGHLGAALAICFVAMALGVGYWSLVRAPALAVRDDNPRLIEAERRIRRGHILDRHGRLLAGSEEGRLGVWERVYPAPEVAPVVGYYSIDHGTGGIEAAYDAQLRGARSLSPVEQLRADLLHLHAAGVSVTLTLDLGLQKTASLALGEQTGAVVLLDVRSGDVLALASNPTFDPNTLEEDWPDLQFSPAKPMLNRATQGLYSPGLVFQTVTLVAAIEEGLAGPTTLFTDELGVILTVEPPVSCPAPPPRPQFSLSEAFAWPCNVLFARLGLDMGGEKLADYAARLGIGRPISLPLPVSTGQLLARGVWSRLLTARTAIGQGEVLVTPLEMALTMATIANDGQRPVLRVAIRAGEEPLSVPGQPRQALQPETARQAQAVLAQAFAAGWPDVPGHDVAGRAGSAESGQPGAPPHAWFIGFAPVTEPRYAISVIVEYGGDGWQVAAPIAVQVLSQVQEGD